MNTDRFKFRIWDNKTKQYLNTADLYLDSNGELCVQRLFCGRNEMFHDVDYGDCHIVEQCTGLKDANGKLIYEGDVLLSSDGSNYSVEYDVHYARHLRRGLFHNGNRFLSELNSTIAEKFLRVVGNIHENPELLEGNK